MSLTTVCSEPSSLEFIVIFFLCPLALSPLSALLPLPCSSLNSFLDGSYTQVFPSGPSPLPCLIFLGQFGCSPCCAFTNSVLMTLKVGTAGSNSALNFGFIPEAADWRLGCLVCLCPTPPPTPGGACGPGRSQGR